MRFIHAVVLAVIVTSGCDGYGGDGVYNPPGAPATITLSSTSTEPLVAVGETRLFSAVVKDAKGAVIAAPTLSWRTSAAAVATVSGTTSDATVTAVDDGTAVITASIGQVEGTLPVTVRRRIASIELTGPDSVVAAGSSTQLSVIARDGNRAEIRGPIAVSYTSNNTFGVVVSPNGLASALFIPWHPLTAIVTATATQDGLSLSATKRIDIGSPAPAKFDAAALLLTESVEPNPVPGLGLGASFFTVSGDRVQYKMVWSLLSGPPVAAHIHGPDAQGDLAPILVDLPLGTPSGTFGSATGSFSGSDIRGRAGAAPISLDSLVKVLKLPASAYVDVHTERFVDGEMRGPAIGIQPAPSVAARGWPWPGSTRR